jgi:hypothetical protein
MRNSNIRRDAMMSMKTTVRSSLLSVPLVLIGMASSTVFAHGEIELSGAVEVEANFTSDAEFTPGADSSDIALATVELGIDVEISDRVSGHVLLLWEEDDTDPIAMDEGTITLQLTDGLSLTGGKMYVPFGNFETNLVSDPLTLELGETNESALQLGFETGGVSGSVYIFNGDVDEAADIADGKDEIASLGAKIGFMTEAGGGELNLGASYISNITDSDFLQEVCSGSSVDSAVSGIGVFASWVAGQLTVIAEHISSDDILSTDCGGGAFAGDVAPTASNLEVAYTLSNGVSLAAGYQMTDEAHDLGLAETKVLVAAGMEVMEGATFSVEFSSSDDYDTLDGGTGESSSTLLFQLASEF